MGISGSLKDVSVADVMQFIHLGRRTGTLLLARGSQRAMIGFHTGRLVSAQAPRTPKLGDLLISSGLIDRGILDEAIEKQRQEQERRSLGRMLIASGAIDAEGLRRVIAQQIEQAVSEVMVWDTGTFEFAIDDLRPIDDIALYPSDVLPDADINTQMVLLEAARIFDERNRSEPEAAAEAGALARDPRRSGTTPVSTASYSAGDSTHPTLLAAEPATPSTPSRIAGLAEPHSRHGGVAATLRPSKHPLDRLQLHVVSTDHHLAGQLRHALRHEVGAVEPVSLGQAGAVAVGEPPPIVLIDLRQGQVQHEQAATLRRVRPRASIIALVDPGTSFAKVFEAGVLTAVPAEIEAVAACVENVIQSRGDLLRGPAQSAADLETPQDGEILRAARAASGEEEEPGPGRERGVPREGLLEAVGEGEPGQPGGHGEAAWAARSGQSGVARLRRVFGDLRSGLISATVALNLMHIISESVERAILFLVKRDHLVALGAFGADALGRPLAELTRGLKLPLLGEGGESVFSRSLAAGEVQSEDFDQAALPEPFRSLVGRSRTGQVVVFPVLGAQRVISVIYADNGERDEPIEDIDILELATAQVGMAFENELLRRQISQNREE